MERCLEPGAHMKVADWMQTNLKTIGVEATVAQVVAALADARVSALPVIDRAGRAVGVVSTRDVLRAEREHDTPEGRERLFERARVLEIMNPWPLTIPRDAELRQAALDMVHYDTQRLFVVDRGTLVGVISQTDIVGALATGRLGPVAAEVPA